MIEHYKGKRFNAIVMLDTRRTSPSHSITSGSVFDLLGLNFSHPIGDVAEQHEMLLVSEEPGVVRSFILSTHSDRLIIAATYKTQFSCA